MPASPSPSPSVRLFLAVWPDPASRAALADWQRSWRWPPGAALVPSERLHLTLHFLGNVPVARVPQLVAALRLPFVPFELRFARVQLWPGGLAVVRMHSTPDELLALHARLAGALRALDLEVDTRPYRAHVTLARKAAGAAPAQPAPEHTWHASQGYALVRSLPNGAGYEVLERFS